MAKEFDPRTSRGFLNNNPGNMDRSEPPWQGEIRDPADPRLTKFQHEELTKRRFCVFVSPQLGIRAMARNLFAYTDRLGLCEIEDLIRRWAPPVENDTAAYIDAVARRLGVRPDACVNLRDWKVLHAIVDAIIRHECGGMPYAGSEIEEGLLLAGVPKPVGLTTSTTAQGATLASGGTIGGAGVSAVQEATKAPPQIPAPLPVGHDLPPPDFGGATDAIRQTADSLTTFAGTSQTVDTLLFGLKLALAAVALVGIGMVIYGRIKQWRRDQVVAVAAQESGL